MPERRSGNVLSGTERAGRRGGRAVPHLRRPGRLPGLGAARSATATASGAAPRRASGGRCWSPGASEVAARRPADGRSTTAGPPMRDRAARRLVPVSWPDGAGRTMTRVDGLDAIATPSRAGGHGSTPIPPAARRRPRCSSSATAPAATSTRPTCSRCATPRVAAGVGVALVTQPYRVAGPPRARTGGAAGRGLDRGRRRAAPSGPGRAAGRRRPVQRRPGGLPHRGRGWAPPACWRWPSRCTRPAGRTQPAPTNCPPACRRWCVNGDRDPFGVPTAGGARRGGGAPGETHDLRKDPAARRPRLVAPVACASPSAASPVRDRTISSTPRIRVARSAANLAWTVPSARPSRSSQVLARREPGRNAPARLPSSVTADRATRPERRGREFVAVRSANRSVEVRTLRGAPGAATCWTPRSGPRSRAVARQRHR